jgi:DNA-binding NtrC family response regulator
MGLTPPTPIAAPQAVPVVQESAVAVPASNSQVVPLHELEKRAIFEALERTNGNRTQAAELLQISIRTLRNKLAEYRGDNEDAA